MAAPARKKITAPPSPLVDGGGESSWLARVATPTTFMGLAGRGEHEVEIWEFRRKVVAGGYSEKNFLVGVYDRKRNLYVGAVELHVSLVSDGGEPLLDPGCETDLEHFVKHQGVSSSEVMQVEGTILAPIYRGGGVGVAMYVASAAVARRLGLALVADSCFYSSTSVAAARVWDSLEFRKSVSVGISSGRVAVFDFTRSG